MNVVLYCRYSSEGQREESIEAQVRACSDFCREREHVIIHQYVDRAKSAKSDDRPEFLRLMQDAELKKFEAVVVHKLNRFSRNKSDHEFYKRHLKKCGVLLVSVTERIDDTPEGGLMESVMQGMSEFYVRDLAREVWKGLKENALKAKWNGGVPPLGYDVGTNGDLVINEAEAATVRHIFKKRAAGYGLTAICMELNKRGARTKRGQLFGKNSLHDLLKNERYLGHYIYGRTERNFAGKRNGHKKSSRIIRVENAGPVLVDIDTWLRVQKMFRHHAASTAKSYYLLRGIIRCGKCGGAMIGNRQVKPDGILYLYYKCGRRDRSQSCPSSLVRADLVEGAILRAIREDLLAPAFRPALLDSVIEGLRLLEKENTAGLQGLTLERLQVKRKIENLVSLAEEGSGSLALVERLNGLTERLRQLDRQAADQASMKTAAPSRQAVEAQLVAYADSLIAAEKEKEPEKFRPVIDMFVESVIVFKEKIVINLKIDGLPPSGTTKASPEARKKSSLRTSGTATPTPTPLKPFDLAGGRFPLTVPLDSEPLIRKQVVVLRTPGLIKEFLRS